MTKRAAIYLRVSTSDQTTENQRRELEAVAARADWEIVTVFEDHGISGAKGKDQRPQFAAMLKAATRREFDVLMVWSVDRLGRSLSGLVETLQELHDTKRGLYIHQQGIDTTTPAGKAMFQMLGVFAEFERAMIRERVNSGLARARANGTQLGRPRKGAKIRQRVKDLAATGQSLRGIAAELGLGQGTVRRIVKEVSL